MAAAVLFDGDWRSEDYEELISEYSLTTEEAEELCNELKGLED